MTNSNHIFINGALRHVEILIAFSEKIKIFKESYLKNMRGLLSLFFATVAFFAFCLLLWLVALPARLYLMQVFSLLKKRLLLDKDPALYKMMREKYYISHFDNFKGGVNQKKHYFLYALIFPLRFIFRPAENFLKFTKKQIDDLDKQASSKNSETELFVPISEKELWETRISVYHYKV